MLWSKYDKKPAESKLLALNSVPTLHSLALQYNQVLYEDLRYWFCFNCVPLDLNCLPKQTVYICVYPDNGRGDKSIGFLSCPPSHKWYKQMFILVFLEILMLMETSWSPVLMCFKAWQEKRLNAEMYRSRYKSKGLHCLSHVRI